MERKFTPAERAMRQRRGPRPLSRVERAHERTTVPLRFSDLPDIPTQPDRALEAARGPLIAMLLELAQRVDDPEYKARVCMGLLKLSSMGRLRMDITHTHKYELSDLPDLSHLSVAQWEQVLQSADEDLPALLASFAPSVDATSERPIIDVTPMPLERSASGSDVTR